MEEVETEVLNESKIEISKLAELKTVKKQIATMVINGQSMNPQTIEQQVLVCPSCGYTLQEFQPGYTAADINGALLDKQTQDALYSLHSYCPHCGQKLSYDREVVSDQ